MTVETDRADNRAPQASGTDAASRGTTRLLTFLLPSSIAMYALYQATQQILIPAQVAELDPANKIGNLALLTSISSISAVLGLLFGGAVSDRTRSKWGRRSPSLLVSAAISALLTFAMAGAGSFLMLGVVYTILWFTANFYQAALTAVLPDRVPVKSRGIASAVMGLGTPLGILIGVNFAAFMDTATSYKFLGLLLVIATILFVAFNREDSSLDLKVDGGRIGFSIASFPSRMAEFLDSFKNRDFALAFFSRAMMFFAQFTISGYMYYIIQDYIGVENIPDHNVKSTVGILGSVNTVVWIVSVIIAGWISDKFDRRKVIVAICSVGLAFSMFVPIISPSWEGILVYKILSGIFFGTYMAIDLALMSLVIPNKNNAGRDMAILAVATAGPQILAPVIAAVLIGLGGYSNLFIFGFVMAMLGGVTVSFIKSVR